jgi:hypothetical protein
MERELTQLFNLIGDYYDKNEETSIERDTLLRFYDLKYPMARDKELYYDVIRAMFELEVADKLMLELLDQLLEKHVAAKIVNELIPTVEGSKYGTLVTAKAEIDEYINLLAHPPEELTVPEPCMMTLQELVEQEIMDEGIPWRMSPVTKTIGGIRICTLGLIYAYVNAGKTSFAMDNMAAQAATMVGTDELICYAGNEEKAPRLRLRYGQAILKIPRTQVALADAAMQKKADSLGFNNVRIFDQVVTGEQVLFILNEYRPSILYIDQATDVEVNFKRRQEGVSYLQALFKWYRHMANIYDCAIVAVAQGVGEAADKKWLSLPDMYGSRVAIQGALDYAIGIGRKDVTKNPTEDEFRYIHIPKNKLYDGEGIKFKVHFDHQRCLWKVI